MAAADVDRAMAGGFVDWLQSSSGLAYSTQKLWLVSLHKLWVWLESGNRGGVTMNPWSKQDLGKGTSAPLKAFPEDVLVKYLIGAREWRAAVYDAIRVAVGTGARQRAVGSLQGADLREFADGLWAHIKNDKGKERLIAIHDSVAHILRRRWKEHGDGALFPEFPLDADGRRGHVLAPLAHRRGRKDQQPRRAIGVTPIELLEAAVALWGGRKDQ